MAEPTDVQIDAGACALAEWSGIYWPDARDHEVWRQRSTIVLSAALQAGTAVPGPVETTEGEC